jgi:hypothetical protein
MAQASDRPETTKQEGVWRLRSHGETARCRACGRSYPELELDETSWCQSCGVDLDRKARWVPHLIAACIVIPFAVWVVLGGQFAVLPRYAWLIPLAAAYYLGFRIGREVVKGYGRWRRARVVDPVGSEGSE